ncbi:hypothetical protein [Streptomyces sp. NPDC001546]|uniref:hypothetical protein n=1 Tax=Streptomyces sp. NPDC001546 TaxID=3364585 RepID=UPI0036C8CCAE
MRPDGERIRVRLADTAGQNALVDLPTSFGRERGIDHLVGDPLWRGATPSAAPALYVLTGFDHPQPRRRPCLP